MARLQWPGILRHYVACVSRYGVIRKGTDMRESVSDARGEGFGLLDHILYFGE